MKTQDILLGALVVGAVGVVGYYMGRNNNPARLLPKGPPRAPDAPAPTPSPSGGDTPTPSPAPPTPSEPTPPSNAGEEAPMPGGLYGGSNPPPWDDMGISETHKQVDSQLSMVEGPDGEMYPDGWALYEHGTAGVLFGVVAAYRPNGWSFGSFKGPFDSVEDGVDTLESFYTTRKAGIQGGTFEGFEKETKT